MEKQDILNILTKNKEAYQNYESSIQELKLILNKTTNPIIQTASTLNLDGLEWTQNKG